MRNTSQESLMTLAQRAKNKGDYQQSNQYLEEALRMGHDTQIVLMMCDNYLKLRQSDQAYFLIKEESDLFSNASIWKCYLEILQTNHFEIEIKQLAHLRQKTIPLGFEPLSETAQSQIMKNFRQKNIIQERDYLKLYKLTLKSFVHFTQSLLLDPSQDFALRLTLCEDLVKLGIKTKTKVFVLGESTSFVPANTELLAYNSLYREIISSLGDRYFHEPSKLPEILAEANLILGSLYPKLSEYIDEPDGFASDFNHYLVTRNGRSHHDLLEKIYRHLPTGY